MSNLDYLLSDLSEQAGNSYELDNFELEQSYEVENFLVENYGMARFQARNKAAQIVQNPVALKNVQRAMSVNAGNGVIASGVASPTSKIVRGTGKSSAAYFNIVIKRVTANISASLPVPVFGYSDLASAYESVLAAEMPSGVSLIGVQVGTKSIGTKALPSIAADGFLYNGIPVEPLEGTDFRTILLNDYSNASKAVFYYSNGSVIDAVEVTCNEVAYPYFLESVGTNEFAMSKLRLTLSNAALVSQFSNRIKITNNSMFGSENSQNITPTQFKDPKNFQDGILDIDGTFPIDKQKTMIFKIIDTADFELTVSAFVEVFYKA